MIWSAAAAAAPAVGFWGAMLLGALLGAAGVTFLRGARPRTIGLAALALVLAVPALARALPYTFTNGTIADATQVNADFSSLVGTGKSYYNASTSFGTTAMVGLSTGVSVATLSLPAGSYVVHAKWRYQGSSVAGATCAFYSPTVGVANNPPILGNDGSAAGSGQIDGYTLNLVSSTSSFSVILGCYGPTTATIVNPQIVAQATTAIVTQ
jgi:hypothetical protein